MVKAQKRTDLSNKKCKKLKEKATEKETLTNANIDRAII